MSTPLRSQHACGHSDARGTQVPVLPVNSRTFLKFLVAGLLAPASAPAQDTAPSPAPQVVLRPGDAVRITVWRRPELSGEFVVDGGGALTHPLYRALQVTDVPLSVAEGRVKTFLTTYESNPSFAFEPLLRVTISGEVARPNLYTLRPETSVAQAVAMAGGATARARVEKARLLRDGATSFIDLSRPESGLAQTRVRSGDQIQLDVRRSMFRDYVTPAITITGATAAILNVILRNR